MTVKRDLLRDRDWFALLAGKPVNTRLREPLALCQQRLGPCQQIDGPALRSEMTEKALHAIDRAIAAEKRVETLEELLRDAEDDAHSRRATCNIPSCGAKGGPAND